MLLTIDSPREAELPVRLFLHFRHTGIKLRPYGKPRSLYEQKSPPQRPSMAQSFRNRGALSGYIAPEVKSFFVLRRKKLRGPARALRAGSGTLAIRKR